MLYILTAPKSRQLKNLNIKFLDSHDFEVSLPLCLRSYLTNFFVVLDI